jgi:hypothetical protein
MRESGRRGAVWYPSWYPKGIRPRATSANPANLRALVIEVLLILSGLVPLVLALVGLGRYGVAKYRRWRNAREVPVVWFDRW